MTVYEEQAPRKAGAKKVCHLFDDCPYRRGSLSRVEKTGDQIPVCVHCQKPGGPFDD